MRPKLYLVGIICFAIATVMGVIALGADKGQWSQVAIPFVLLLMAIALWWRARKSTV